MTGAGGGLVHALGLRIDERRRLNRAVTAANVRRRRAGRAPLATEADVLRAAIGAFCAAVETDEVCAEIVARPGAYFVSDAPGGAP